MDVGKALRNTPKGQLKYDRFWTEEGRVKDFIDYISKFSTKVPINISPKVLSQVIRSCNEEEINTEESEKNHAAKSKPTETSKSSKDSDTIFYEIQTETELPILEYEEERLKYIEDIFKAKKEEFENYSKNLQQQTEQQYHLLKRNVEFDQKRRAVDLKKIEDTIIEEAKKRELLLKQHQQTQAKKLSAIVLEAEMKQKKAEEEMKRREQEQQEFALQLNNCKLEAENCVSKVEGKLKACEHPSFLKCSVSDRMMQMKEFLEDINAIVERISSHPLTIEDVFSVSDVVKKIYEALQDITNDIEHAKIKALQEHEKKLLESRVVLEIPKENDKLSFNKLEADSVSAASGIQIDNENSDKNIETEKSKLRKEAKDIISAFIAPDVVEEYHKIMENLKNVQCSIEPFIDDPRNKKYRFELQKSINVPINAVSSVSGSHVRDKISRLLTILGAKTPSKEMTNESIIYNFCANLIARKFVEQGDKQISAQHSTAFPFALAIVGVWIKKPDVGSLILGHFYSNCPYLVPYYPPRKENQSDKEYFESLGYYFDRDGNMEVKYKFLNRMSGFMRLYAAIILSPVPSSAKYPHPHGIAYGWQWLSRILNIDPRPDITATLLYDFLEVTGHALQRTYGKQFKKLLHIICKDFFQKIKRVTPSGSGGPVERLETFLQQIIKEGYIPRPEGILDAGFWNR